MVTNHISPPVTRMAKLGLEFIKIVFKLATVCVICLGYINAGKSQIISIFHEICGVWLHFAGNILKTQEIQGEMFNTLVKWLHYMWLFLKIQDILVNLINLCENFSKNLEDSIQDAGVLQSLY